MSSTSEIWKFIDEAERAARVGFGSGVSPGDLSVIPNGGNSGTPDVYDSVAELWLPGIRQVSTTDATLLSTFIGQQPTNLTTQQYEVWIQSVRDTGVNWRFRQVSITSHRIAGVITLSAPVDIVPVTSAGTGATLAYGFSAVPDWIFADITGNALENWEHTIRVVTAQAGP